MRIIITIPALLFLFLVNACELPHQPGQMPTDIVETEFEPGLNIMGVLRADDRAGTSFININRALTTEEIYSDSIPNFSPYVDYVEVKSVSNNSTFNFTQGNINGDWWDYKNSYLRVETGETYELEISAPGFPLLTGQTIVPQKPSILTGSLLNESETLSFKILHHASAYEYKLYLLFSGGVLEKGVNPSNETQIQINWDYDNSLGTPTLLVLSALDENLTRYGNSPISFIPNTYHPDGSTVEGGYGCFGSVSITSVELN